MCAMFIYFLPLLFFFFEFLGYDFLQFHKFGHCLLHHSVYTLCSLVKLIFWFKFGLCHENFNVCVWISILLMEYFCICY